MDRQIVYPGAIPLETDLLNTNKNAMIGLAKLAAAILGTGTMLNGLACTPDSPASLNVKVAPGEIHSLQNIDGTAYSSLAADTAHGILKQGIMLDSVLLSCPAPAANGYSINYLIQVAYQDTDANATVLPYYNASNPSQAYSGPNNAGTANYTTRKGVCTVSVKAGVAATTGTQATPAPDAGYTGIYSVVVAYGQTQITAGNINAISGAPFINSTLLGISPAFSISPTVPTPPPFDNSQKAVNSAFLKATGEAFGGLKSVTGAATLDAAHAGKLTIFGGTTFAVTLPAASTYPSGTTLTFHSTASGVVTLNRAGLDQISVNNSLALKSLAMGGGDTLTLVSNGTSIWEAIAGSSQLRYASLFASSLSNSGYKKIPDANSPSGVFIFQWGLVRTFTGTDVTTSYPIAFPNGVLHVFMTGNYTPESGAQAYYNAATQDSLISFVSRASAAIGAHYLAIGY